MRVRAYQRIASALGQLMSKTQALAAASRPVQEMTARPVVWFHAASVGELEMLWGVIEEMASTPIQLVLTVFSGSAIAALDRLTTAIKARAPEVQILASGFSPREGDWTKKLSELRPSLFVTAKYEAWPELWAGLSRLGIPLAIVNAQARKSLKLVRLVLKLMGLSPPRLLLLTHDVHQVAGLRQIFSAARIEITGEPRWDRVFSRAATKKPRVAELVAAFQEAARPWGVMGSAWPEDLKIWSAALRDLRGTVWIVPHQVGLEDLNAILGAIPAGLNWVRSSQSTTHSVGGRAQVIVVDEMGLLSELYAHADWAWVGGGFGVGIHSTIEPSIHGIPVGCGPKSVHRFLETQGMIESGQLRVIKNPSQLRVWLSECEMKKIHDGEKWRKMAESKRGATQRVVSRLREVLTGSSQIVSND